MAKKVAKDAAVPAPLGGLGHYDYEPDYDPNDTVNYYRGRESAGGLEERNGSTKATQTPDVEPYEAGCQHHNRTRSEPEGITRQLRQPTIEDGVSFSEKLRSDLDDDIAGW